MSKIEEVLERLKQELSQELGPALAVADDLRALLADHARLQKIADDRDEGESQAIRERDHAERIIDHLCDAVLGDDREEWSSGYDFGDAVDDVTERMAAVSWLIVCCMSVYSYSREEIAEMAQAVQP